MLMTNNNNNIIVKKGQVWYADLGEQRGSIQHGLRPCIINSNWKCNIHSTVIMVVPLTNAVHNKAKLPTHVLVTSKDGVKETSIALVEQHMPLNKSDLKYLISECTKETMDAIDKAYQVQGGIEVVDINKLLDLTDIINDLTDSLEDNYTLERYHECSMLITELKSYCFRYNIDFELKYNRLINRYRKLKYKEGISCVI